MTVRIIDTSNHQGVVDWAQVLRSGVAGGIVKATEGTGYRDPTFPASWAALGAAGAVRGAYHFAHPDQDPVAQADYFLGYIKPLGLNPADILVLDLETGTGNMDGFAWNFLVHVQAQTNIRPWFYSYGPFIRAHLTDPRLAAFPLWLAAYQPTQPAPPAPWATIQLWQHSDSAHIPGVVGNCDESIGTVPGPVGSGGGPDMAQVANALGAPGGGVWVAAKDGGVFAYKGAPFYGSYPGLPPNQRQGTRTCVDIVPRDDGQAGYMLLFDDQAKYRFP